MRARAGKIRGLVASAFASIFAGPSIGAGRDEIVIHTSLRGVAALCVVMYHASRPFQDVGADIPLRFEFFQNGYLFVDLFFILSGFILTRKYLGWFAHGLSGPAVRHFLQLRFARIYPNYLLWFLLALGLELAVATYFGRLSFGGDEALSAAMHLVMLQSIFEAPVIWNTPLWSITVEAVAYLLFPVLALCFLRFRQAFLASSIAVSLAAIVAIALTTSIDVIEGLLSVVRGLAGFMLGAAIARLAGATLPFSTTTLSIAQVAAAAALFGAVSGGREIAAILAAAALVWLTVENRGVLLAVARPRLVYSCGLLSYSIYLSHTSVQRGISLLWYNNQEGAADPQATFLVLAAGGLVGAWLLAVVSFTLVEVPGRYLLRPRNSGDPRPTLRPQFLQEARSR